MLLDKEQIWVIFEFKMSHKAAETTCNINHAFGLGTANIQCSGGSRSFAKETRTLEMRSAMADHRKLTTTNGEQFLKVILLQLQEKFPRTQHQPFYSFLAFETNWKVGASWADRKSKKIVILKCGLVVTVWWSAAHWIHYSFPNPSKTITSEKCAQQIDEMHPKLQRLQPALVNRKGPILLCHDNA